MLIFYNPKTFYRTLHISRHLPNINLELSFGNSTLNRCHFETKHFCHRLVRSYTDNHNVQNVLQIKRKDLMDSKKCDFNGKFVNHLLCKSGQPFNKNYMFCHHTIFEQMKLTVLLNRVLNNAQTIRCRHFSSNGEKGNGDSTVNGDTIENVLKKYVDKRYQKGYACYITACTKLGKKHLTMINEADKLYINSTTGHFLCNHCKKSGQWLAFVDNINAISLMRKNKILYDCHVNNPDVKDIGEEPQKVREMYDKAIQINSLSKEDYESVTTMFGCSGLLKSVLSGYGVKYAKETESLLFPYFNPDQSLVAVKQMSAVKDEDETVKIKQKFFPRIGTWQLFGWKKAKDVKGSVVITGNELDAMAVYQATGSVTLSLPKGYTIRMPQEILPFLERFDKVTFWLGNDAKSWDATKMFALKVNEKRCHVIRPSAEDCMPLEGLQNGVNLKKIIDTAKPYIHQSIVSFSNLKDEVYSELSMMEQVTGVKWHRYSALNKLLKGHRRGELTVFTGPTGSGKTTFMSEYSLDLCMQGVSTLWGSFEIQNVRLARVMLMQYALKNLHNHLDEYGYWSEKFDQLPMHFMTFYGQENIAKVIDTMSHAVYVHDIGHVIVDNLQFMMGMDFSAMDRFVKQDHIVAAFRRFASQKNCHVTLIIHPRKEKSDEELTIASIFGSAKVSQEADNILILQDKTLTTARGRKFIQVVKNRHSGDRGMFQLKFDGESLTFSGVTPSGKEKTKVDKTTVVPEVKKETDDTEKKETKSENENLTNVYDSENS